MPEKCPGCRNQFAQSDITAEFRWPFSDSTEKLKWHIRCHQDACYKELNKDRRTLDQRRAVGDK